MDACITLETVPPFPAPSSFNVTRSSLRRSRRNSRPISSVSVLLTSLFPTGPGACASPSVGLEVGLGAALRARPLTFLRFNVRAWNGSVMAAWRGLELHKGKVVKEKKTKSPVALSDIKSALPKPMGSEWSERTPELTAGKSISPCDVLGDADWTLRARRFDRFDQKLPKMCRSAPNRSTLDFFFIGNMRGRKWEMIFKN